MKLLYQYLRSRAIIVALMFAFILIFVIVFALYRLPLQTVLYPAGLCLLLGTGCGVVDFLWMVKRHKALEAFKGEYLIDYSWAEESDSAAELKSLAGGVLSDR